MIDKVLKRKLKRVFFQNGFVVLVAIIDAEGLEITGHKERRLHCERYVLGIVQHLFERRFHNTLAKFWLVKVYGHGFLLDHNVRFSKPSIDVTTTG